MINLCEQLFLHNKILSSVYKLGNLPLNEGFSWCIFLTSAHHHHCNKNCLLIPYSFEYTYQRKTLKVQRGAHWNRMATCYFGPVLNCNKL